MESSPLYENGTLYVTGADDTVIAINADTGRMKWRYEPDVVADRLCCGRVNGQTPNARTLGTAERSKREPWSPACLSSPPVSI